MALGGVATGSIKAHEAAIAVGIIKRIGLASMAMAIAPMMGMKTVEIAVLEVTSVRKVMDKQIPNRTNKMGSPFNTTNPSPNH